MKRTIQHTLLGNMTLEWQHPVIHLVREGTNPFLDTGITVRSLSHFIPYEISPINNTPSTANDYWSFNEEKCDFKSVRDLWIQNETYDGPAYSLQNGDSCSQSNQNPESETCVFEEEILGKEVRRIISTHDVSSKPLFLFWSMHLVHMPLQVPNEYLSRFSQIDDSYRQKMHAMMNYVDDEIREITMLLKERNMWNNTLLVFHTDNGGEIMAAGTCGGNNYPLRGGKFSNFEGGIRVNAFVSGGFLPASRRGVRENGLITSWDWLRTLTAVAGLSDVKDERARKAGLPPIDSLNAWPLISGENSTSPRVSVLIGDTSAEFPNGDGETLVGTYCSLYRLLQ